MTDTDRYREEVRQILEKDETVLGKCQALEKLIRTYVLKERGRCYMIARRASTRQARALSSCSPCDIAREIIGDEQLEG